MRTIGGSAFSSSSNLTSVLIPDGVTNISDWAFSWCTKLTSITIPSSVTNFGNRVFSYCFSLEVITVDGLNPFYRSLDDVLFDKDVTTLIQYPASKAGIAYEITNSVTTIGDAAFLNCIGLTGVTIPTSVSSIGGWAFSYCANLTNISIPYRVANIGMYAFSSCQMLTSLAIPDSISKIETGLFFKCDSLTNVMIPAAVTRIGNYAFYRCTNLIGVYFRGNAPGLGGQNVFNNATHATVYYKPGTIGWGSTFGGRPTAPWMLPYPEILTISPFFGIQTNAFGFRISWATNVPVVVEASMTLANSGWSSVSTNTLTNGWSYFSDPAWVNYPSRFYRIRSQ